MGFNVASLWQAPDVNPINKKARSVPFLNPINKYGRVFFFSWLSFLLAFWSWYAFPPLLGDVIKADLKISTNVVLNSNIIGLTATLLVRLIAGPACDWIGPRYTFAGCLLIGAIPTFLAGTVYNAGELYACRFFVGILGGSFVPCQVWTTGFYDKNIIGTANAITAGLGNAGGGITYFVMPAVYNSLVHHQGLSPHTAWRVAFVVPGILIVTSAILLVVCCEDTPTGKWSDRMQAAENNLREHGVDGAIVDVPGSVIEQDKKSDSSGDRPSGIADEEKKLDSTRGTFGDHEVQLGSQQMLDTARGEVIQKPSFTEIIKVCFSPSTLCVAACYFCTFGTELSVNSILGNYYSQNFKYLGLQGSGNWAAMFGLMNVVFRPLGGMVSDFAYGRTKSVWSKKILLHAYCLITGAFCVAIGLTNSHHLGTMVCLVGVGLAFFLEGANGLNYSLVPHVHPYANGVVSGMVGASGNFGGIIFSIIFRYSGGSHNAPPDYHKAIWIIGCVVMAVQVCIFWVPPLPKGQVGGR